VRIGGGGAGEESRSFSDALKESPGAFLGLVLRQFGQWLKDAFGGE
jgi:hypothetical protein